MFVVWSLRFQYDTAGKTIKEIFAYVNFVVCYLAHREGVLNSGINPWRANDTCYIGVEATCDTQGSFSAELTKSHYFVHPY